MSGISNVTIQRASNGATRHETHEGRDHLVVPVVMIREGVLNGALVTAEEFGKVAQAWNGRPVTVAHPEQNGAHVSANADPKILERTVGKLFNARADGDKLKAEAWIDVEKAKALGHSVTLATLEAGAEGMEVSTGYWADSEESEGEHNGRPYTHIDRNIVPDHLALLPGDIGACSWGDGCGVRANQDQGGIKAALNTMARFFGLSSHCAGECAGDCQCKGGPNMAKEPTVAERIDALKANKQITPEQLQMVQKLDEEQANMMLGIIESMLNNKPEPEPEPEPEAAADDEDPNDPMRANKSGNVTVNQKQLDELIASRVDDGIRRGEVMRKLTANSDCAFNETQLKAMATDQLETYEKSIRPADYSGQGGFAANSDAIDNDAAPLTLNRGVLSQPTTNTEQ